MESNPILPAEITALTIAKFIDHTLISADATKIQIRKLCEEAVKYNFFSVCVNSGMISCCKDILKGTKTNIVGVIGFPLGACESSVKSFETNRAINLGADEIDMVMQIGQLKSGELQLVERDIHDVVLAAEGKKVKVIVETGLLSQDEKKKAAEICESAGAHFIKTCSGFGAGIATVDDIKFFKSIISSNIKIKASGGIKDFGFAKLLIQAGSDRIGTSHGVSFINFIDLKLKN